MRTFTVALPDGNSNTVTAESMELRADLLVFLKAGEPVAAFARWTSVIEDGVATPNPASAPLAEPQAVTALRESMRERGATV
jgi:hypothetical protein